jgi:hypothetical protein
MTAEIPPDLPGTSFTLKCERGYQTRIDAILRAYMQARRAEYVKS